jgi:alpha-ketoglutarate-dependent taurine dioxygenase
MTSPSSHPPLDVERHPGRPPMLTVHNGHDPAQWAEQHREALRAAVDEHGAVLVRGLGLQTADEVAAVFRELAPGGLMPDREAFAARRPYAEGVYSSLTWPANQPMCMHPELSYAEEFPGLLLFACLQAPDAGGVTGVADARAVLEALPEDLVRRFEEEGWLLARSYNEDVGASYEEAFGVADRAGVEDYCRSHAIEFEWQSDGELRTRQRRPAVVRHPETGQRCWFNQVAFLSEWTIAPEIREYLVDVYGPEGLPFNTRFGTGEPIGEDVVALVNGVYEEHTLRTPWEPGDLMLVDNIRMAHSREAYAGDREVLVGMAEPRRTADLAAPTQEGAR